MNAIIVPREPTENMIAVARAMPMADPYRGDEIQAGQLLGDDVIRALWNAMIGAIP